MGLDVNLYAEGEVTEAELEAGNAYILARCDIADDWKGTGRVLVREHEEWHDGPRISLSTMVRFYGQHYERGPWPNIYGAIRLLQSAFPGCRVFYGSDSSDDGIECTDDYLAEVWEHFLGPHGDDYRRSTRELNARAWS